MAPGPGAEPGPDGVDVGVPAPRGVPAGGVVVVTDSTASLPRGAAERWGVEVVPLEVALGDARYREGVDLRTEDLLAALTDGTPVRTSQPSPAAFARAYARAAGRGARAVVSVHLSGELSGTVRAAELAAVDAPVPVHVVDSGTVVMGLGFAVLAAAEAAVAGKPAASAAAAERVEGPADGQAEAPAGGPADGRAAEPAVGPADEAAWVADRARAVAASSWVLVVVDSLDHLRRGGRIGAAAAAVGGLLGMRPLLTVRDGRVEVAGTVRTRRAARERLVDTAVAVAAARPGTRVAVHHLGRPDLGEALAADLRGRLAGAAAGAPGAGSSGGGTAEVPEVLLADVSAVIGAHAGPGLLGVVVAGP